MDKNYDVVVKIYRQLDVSRRERNCAIVLYFHQTSEVLRNIIMESIVKDNTENFDDFLQPTLNNLSAPGNSVYSNPRQSDFPKSS